MFLRRLPVLHPAVIWVAIGALLLSVLLFVIQFLIAPVGEAEFRLTARTDFLIFELERDATITLPVADWTLYDVTKLDLKDGSSPREDLSTGRLTVGNVDSGKETLSTWHLTAGSQLLLGLRRDATTRFRMAVASFPAEVRLQLPTRTADLSIELPDDQSSDRLSVGGNPVATVRPGVDASFDFKILRDEISLESAFPISALGFARTRDGHSEATALRRLLPGMIDGAIYFLDAPDSKTRLFRGSDVRFIGIEAVIESLTIKPEGIEVDLGGKVATVDLHIGSSSRSLLPLRYERLKNSPRTILMLGAFSWLFGAVALLLAAAQVFRRLAAVLNRDTGKH